MRPFRERAADSLVQLCSQSLGESQERDPDLATVVCHVDAGTLAGLAGDAELGSGQQLSTETALRLACDCRFQFVKENENGEAIGLGRTTRIIPPWLRRALRLRDGGCRFPGCQRTRWVDRHHIVHWAHGGTTDPANCIQLCRFHHRLLHEDRWEIKGDPAGEVRFVSPSGRTVSSKPAPVRRSILERFGLWDESPDEDDPN